MLVVHHAEYFGHSLSRVLEFLRVCHRGLQSIHQAIEALQRLRVLVDDADQPVCFPCAVLGVVIRIRGWMVCSLVCANVHGVHTQF